MREFDFVKLESASKDKGQRTEVDVVVAAKDVAEVIDEFYSTLARVKHVDGGSDEEIKRQLEKIVGEQDLAAACRDYLLNRFATAAVRKIGFDTVLTPGIHADDMPEKTSDFSFTINLIPRPKLSLSSVEPVCVKKTPIVVEEADINAQLAYTAEQFASFRKTESVVLQEGDFALVDIEMLKNGSLCKELSGNRRTIELTRGLLPGAFIDGVIGMKSGEIRKFDFGLAAPGDFSDSGENVDQYSVDVRLLEVQEKVIPELTDEWVSKNLPQFTDMNGFKAAIRLDLEEQKVKVEKQDLVYKVRSALENRLEGFIPDEMYQDAKDSLMASTLQKIEAQGLTLDEYCDEHDISKDAFNMNVFMQASEYLRQNLALDVLATEKGLIASEEDIRRVKNTLPGAIPKLSDKEFDERGFRKALVDQIKREKAMRWLMETAVIE